ncbi:TRAP transporter, DctQ-like membrane protein [Verrucomicrobiia bacterium DG1235]|nr:TRAP transporter, DctQ-like membrane protein [Verrucomicrobiae bacterium DG1235]
MIAVVALQVFARAFLEKAPPWTEEASRICFLYLIAFGIGPAIRDKKLVRLELLNSYLSPKANHILQFCIQIFITALALILTYQSYKFVSTGIYETSPALGIQMSFLFASMLLLSASTLVFTLEALAKQLRPNPQ